MESGEGFSKFALIWSNRSTGTDILNGLSYFYFIIYILSTKFYAINMLSNSSVNFLVWSSYYLDLLLLS